MTKKKRKKTRSPRSYEDGSGGTWVWWYAALGGLLLAVGAGGMALAYTGHVELVILCAVQLVIMVPVSMVILVASMLVSSAIWGGINFGEVHTAIPKAALLLIVVNLICLLPLGALLALPI
jgi:hypothetical protein